MNRDRIRLNSAGSGEGAQSEPGLHEQLELLISRLADGEGVPSDWETFGALSQRVPEAWKQLAEAQRDHAALCVAVGVALHAADRVDLPSREVAERFHGAGSEHGDVQQIVFWSRVRTWGGWAAAAAIALAWATGGFNGVPAPQQVGNTNIAGLPVIKVSTPDDAVKAYLELGKTAGSVLGEVPQRVLISTAPTADGKGIEATYLRQFIERVPLANLTGFPGVDEAGRRIARPVSTPGVADAPQ